MYNDIVKGDGARGRERKRDGKGCNVQKRKGASRVITMIRKRAAVRKERSLESLFP